MPTQRNPLLTSFLVAACLLLASALGAAPEPARISHETVLRQVSLGRGKDAAPPVARRFAVVVLENRFLRVLVCPELGERILNITDKTTGRETLHEGVIKYSGSALDEGGGSGGGLQLNHPFYHAGSSFVAPLPWHAEVSAEGTAQVTLAHTSYPHLQHSIWRISLRADEAAIRCHYRFENLAPWAMGCNPWISAAFPMWPEAQFLLPTDSIAGHWFGINAMGGEGDWGHHLKPWPLDEQGVDQSYLKHRKWSAAFAYGLTGGYAGIHDHASDRGFARAFDPALMPGAKAAGAWSPTGWLELWGAFTHNMEDPRWLGPHETLAGGDQWWPTHGLGGLSFANEHGALRLTVADAELHLGFLATRLGGAGAIRVLADGQVLRQAALELNPAVPFRLTLPAPPAADELRVLVQDATGRVLLDHQRFLASRPRRHLELPPQPWHKRSPLAEARWQEAFTPMMAWGPWYHPPTSYGKALAASPDDPELMLGLARALLKEASANLFRAKPGKQTPEQVWAQATELLQRLAAKTPPDARAVELLGVVQARQGQAAAAQATLGQVLGGPGETSLARYTLALLAARAGDWPGSVTQAQAALALAPDSTLARLLLATALLRTGQGPGVSAVLAPILAANPGDPRALLLTRQVHYAIPADPATSTALTSELARLDQVAPGQMAAARAALAALASGQDLDPMSATTVLGSPELPGSEP